MQIIDLNGKSITVTNLDEAISQTELFKNFQHENPEYRILDNKLNMYWKDIFEKLMKIKTGSVIP